MGGGADPCPLLWESLRQRLAHHCLTEDRKKIAGQEFLDIAQENDGKTSNAVMYRALEKSLENLNSFPAHSLNFLSLCLGWCECFRKEPLDKGQGGSEVQSETMGTRGAMVSPPRQRQAPAH